MDTGPSILVSALANILADAIGCFIGSLEITLLCLANMAALSINLLFQCTYFVAVMGTVAIIERKTRKEKGTERVKGKTKLEMKSKFKFQLQLFRIGSSNSTPKRRNSFRKWSMLTLRCFPIGSSLRLSPFAPSFSSLFVPSFAFPFHSFTALFPLLF